MQLNPQVNVEASFNKAYMNLIYNYDFPSKYETVTEANYRVNLKDKKNKLNWQKNAFGSFENSDDLAGLVAPNNGYFGMIHIEEPVSRGDAGMVEIKPEVWDSELKVIKNTIKRHFRTYEQRQEDGEKNTSFYKPIPFKVITTMNDWDPEHPISLRFKKYFPEHKFIEYILGFKYDQFLELYSDRINQIDVVPQLKQVIDEKWESIKENLVNNHTGYVYRENDLDGNPMDRLFIRMSVFGNPTIRERKKDREERFAVIYKTLITGNATDLAVELGLGYTGIDDIETRFNFDDFQAIDTDEKIRRRR